MSARFTFRNSIAAMLAAPALVGAGTAFAACTGPGAPTSTETKCLTAVQIPGNPLHFQFPQVARWPNQRPNFMTPFAQ